LQQAELVQDHQYDVLAARKIEGKKPNAPISSFNLLSKSRKGKY
jgi:hypothetical protein